MVPMVPKSEKPMVPKSEKPELLMSSGLVPELPGVPDKQQFPVTPRELGFWWMKIMFIAESFDVLFDSLILQAFGTCLVMSCLYVFQS